MLMWRGEALSNHVGYYGYDHFMFKVKSTTEVKSANSQSFLLHWSLDDNKIADKYVILIIYFSIFILLIPSLKSYWNFQCLQNKISYIGTTFCRRWGIRSCFYWFCPLIFTIDHICDISLVISFDLKMHST